jgi:hypothetical protein
MRLETDLASSARSRFIEASMLYFCVVGSRLFYKFAYI